MPRTSKKTGQALRLGKEPPPRRRHDNARCAPHFSRTQPRQPATPAASRGLTGRLASVSSRRPRRTLLAWGLLVLLSLGLAATSLHGLTSTSHVVGTTPSSRAEALYNRATGGSAGRQPTDVIVVSSKTATASSAAFRSVVGDLAARLRSDPGISGVRADLAPGSPLVSAGGHAALIGLHAASDADIKPVVSTVRAANGTGGFAVAVTGDHTVGNDFTTLSSSDLRHGEIDFGLPISIVILMLVFGAVVAGLMPMLMALAVDHRRPRDRHHRRPGVQPVGLHRQHDDRHGPGARHRLLALRYLPLPGGTRPGAR